jgi:MoxR-like ATPase
MEFAEIRSWADKVRRNIANVIVGKEEVIDRLLIALAANGHILLEDVPGTGKTLLAKTLAKSLDCRFGRVQFTPDLLPSDLSGIHYFNQKTSDFEFRPGPIFCHILLADELNRATPRTQSSLLECMEERQVSVDGVTMKLERPFFVIATQNPVENQGTFPLPEAQLDRFMMRISMGYPSAEESIRILKRFKDDEPLEQVESVTDREEIVRVQLACRKVLVEDSLYEYIVNIVEKTRNHPEVHMGVSPRGSQALLKAAQIHAVFRGRDYMLPDDVKAVAEPVLAHRLLLHDGTGERERQEQVIRDILQNVPVPAEPWPADRIR